MVEPPPARPLKLVVLDRDGVINRESADFIRTPAEWLPLPGSLEAISALGRAGFTVVVATNQSGVGRGLISPAMLTAIHERLLQAVAEHGGSLGGIFVCPHHPDDRCDCRKPKAGLFRQIEARFETSLAGQPAIGDSHRDIEAALAVGARPILVRTGNGLADEAGIPGGIEVCDDLAAAARKLLRELA